MALNISEHGVSGIIPLGLGLSMALHTRSLKLGHENDLDGSPRSELRRGLVLDLNGCLVGGSAPNLTGFLACRFGRD